MTKDGACRIWRSLLAFSGDGFRFWLLSVVDIVVNRIGTSLAIQRTLSPTTLLDFGFGRRRLPILLVYALGVFCWVPPKCGVEAFLFPQVPVPAARTRTAMADQEAFSDPPAPSISSSVEEEAPIPFNSTLNDLDLTALSSKVSYFYLNHELGLSEEIMWKITHDAPSVLGMTASNIRQKVQVLQFALQLSREELQIMLERQPSLLQLSALENLSPTLDWLTEALDLSPPQLRQLVLAQPCLLTCAKANLELKLEFFTTSRGLGFSLEECRTLVLEEPRLWTCGVQSGLLPRVRFLLNEIQIPKEKLRIIVQKNPRILLYSLPDNLAPKLVNYGIMILQMEPQHIIKLLTTYPQVLDYNLDRHILPLTYYMLNDLGYSVHEVRAILLKYPRFLTHSVSKLKHVVGYLRYELELDAQGVKRVLYQAPQLLGLNMETNVKPKVAFLQQFIEVSGGNSSTRSDDADEPDPQRVVQKLILGMPTILNLSVETNLRPKLEYLKATLESPNRPSDRSLPETLLLAPALLGYSLEKRIRPRMEKILDAGVSPSSITVGITMSEDKFEKWLQGRAQRKSKRLSVNRDVFQDQLVQDEVRDESATNRSARILHWNRERNPS